MPGSRVPARNQPELQAWEKLLLCVGDGSETGYYEARIEDFVADAVVVTEPEMVGGSTRLREGSDVVVRLTRDDAIYQFRSRVRRLGHRADGRVALRRPEFMERVQRRLFVRLAVTDPIDLALLPTDQVPFDADGALWHTSKLVNISGGGAGLVTTEPVEMNSVIVVRSPLFVRIGIPEYLIAMVRRMQRAERKGFQIGLEFLVTDEPRPTALTPLRGSLPRFLLQFTAIEQEKLVAWVFNEQISLRQKGLL